MKTRLESEDLESVRLAIYAQRSADTAGRVYPEPRHPFRTEYERDRARIVHSRAFRRLEGKTQVFLSGTGDHLRTRLTHTIEVASISRTIARALGCNEDLAEAIALAHDLGHPPFGHSGERALDELMREHGGFEHNLQSLRIVEMIEQKYPRFPGLNLSWEVREGLSKHAKFHSLREDTESAEQRYCASLEAQIANLADEITYYSHDLDDGLDFALITARQLSGLAVWDETVGEVRQHFPQLRGKELNGYAIRCMIDRQVQDVITTSEGGLSVAGITSVDDVRRQPTPLIRYSAGLLDANRKLRRFLYSKLYHHPRVAGLNEKACTMLKRVFEAYLHYPALLGKGAALRLESEGLHRTVCDYLSGMTDRYVMGEYDRLFCGGKSGPELMAGG